MSAGKYALNRHVGAPHTTSIGLVADTHYPDRSRTVPYDAIQQALAGVDQIVHLGDIVTPKVLEHLAKLAPVCAVKGNHDIWHPATRRLPLKRVLHFGRLRLGVTHGHGGARGYLREKLRYLTAGYRLSEYVEGIPGQFAGDDVDAIVFGHSHKPLLAVRDGLLLFNPGAVVAGNPWGVAPSVGRMIVTGDAVVAERLTLDGEVVERLKHALPGTAL